MCSSPRGGKTAATWFSCKRRCWFFQISQRRSFARETVSLPNVGHNLSPNVVYVLFLSYQTNPLTTTYNNKMTEWGAVEKCKSPTLLSTSYTFQSIYLKILCLPLTHEDKKPCNFPHHYRTSAMPDNKKTVEWLSKYAMTSLYK